MDCSVQEELSNGGTGSLIIAETANCQGDVCKDPVVDIRVKTSAYNPAGVDIHMLKGADADSFPTSYVTFPFNQDILDSETHYTVVMSAGMFNDYGGVTGSKTNSNSKFSYAFVTADITSPYVIDNTPVAETGVSRYTPKFSFEFQEDMAVYGDKTTDRVFLKKKTDGSTTFSWKIAEGTTRTPGYANVGVNKRVLHLPLPTNPLTSSNALEADTEYYFEIGPAVVADPSLNLQKVIAGVTDLQMACPNYMDVCVVVDSSTTVSASEYTNSENFIKNLATKFDGVLGVNGMQIGAVTFASTAETIFELNAHTTAASVNSASFTYLGTSERHTRTGVEACRTMLSSGTGARSDAAKAIILVTSGKDTCISVNGVPGDCYNPSATFGQIYAEGTAAYTVSVDDDTTAQSWTDYKAEMETWTTPTRANSTKAY